MAYFDEDEKMIELADLIYENLPGKNDERVFGEQIVVNENDEVMSMNHKLLIGATSLSIQYIVDRIHALSGLAIASHIDREGFGIIGQLGYIPDDLELDGLEISPRLSLNEAKVKFGQSYNLPFVTSSDAHNLEDIGKSYTYWSMAEANTKEMRKALYGEDGRKVVM